MSSSSAQLQDKYVLRLPDGLRDELKATAKANGRSMNAEIIARLTPMPQLDRIEAALARIEKASAE